MSFRKLLPTFAQSDEFSPAEREVLRAIGDNRYQPPSAQPGERADSLYTTADVCEVLRISRSQFYERDLHKQLVPVSGFTQGHPRYSAGAVQKLIAQNCARVEAAQEVSHAS